MGERKKGEGGRGKEGRKEGREGKVACLSDVRGELGKYRVGVFIQPHVAISSGLVRE